MSNDDDSGNEADDILPYTVVFDDDADAKTDVFLRRDGKALAKWFNGDSYEGTYEAGKRQGKGKYSYSNGACYQGEYVNGFRSGQGEMKYPDNTVYLGSWADGHRHGQGTYNFSSGDTYVGEWRRDKKHGPGVYTYAATQQQVQGLWSNGCLMQGTWTQSGNAKYIGNFLYDQPCGHGINVSAKGHVHAGQYAYVVETKTSSYVPHCAMIPINRTAPSKVTPLPTALQIAERLLQTAVLSCDVVDGAYRLKKEIDGAPNFRRVPETNYFLTGQTTIEGLKTLTTKALSDSDAERLIILQCRSGVSVYIGNESYSARQPKKVQENVFLPNDLSVEELIKAEEAFALTILRRIAHAGQVLSFQREIYAELASDRRGIAAEEEVPVDVKVAGITGVVQRLAEEDGLNVSLDRFHFGDSIIDAEAMSNIVERARLLDDSAAWVFVDEFGRENATFAAALVMAVKTITCASPTEKSTEGSLEVDQMEDTAGTTEVSKAETAEKDSDVDEDESETKPTDVTRDNEEDTKDESKSDVVEPEPTSEQRTTEQSAETGQLSQADEKADYVPSNAAVISAIRADPRNCEYTLVQRFVQHLPRGVQSKQAVDQVIDRMSAVVNLRESTYRIYLEWQECSETNSERAAQWLERGRISVQRYCFLIALTAYLSTVQPSKDPSEDDDEDADVNESVPSVEAVPPTPSFSLWLKSTVDMQAFDEQCREFKWDL